MGESDVEVFPFKIGEVAIGPLKRVGQRVHLHQGQATGSQMARNCLKQGFHLGEFVQIAKRIVHAHQFEGAVHSQAGHVARYRLHSRHQLRHSGKHGLGKITSTEPIAGAGDIPLPATRLSTEACVSETHAGVYAASTR